MHRDHGDSGAGGGTFSLPLLAKKVVTEYVVVDIY